jgi:hypothetical protein
MDVQVPWRMDASTKAISSLLCRKICFISCLLPVIFLDLGQEESKFHQLGPIYHDLSRDGFSLRLWIQQFYRGGPGVTGWEGERGSGPRDGVRGSG